MNVIERLKNNEYTTDELLDILDSKNPIVLYNAMACIAKNNIMEQTIIERLSALSKKLSNEDKSLGYYKTGHLAMSALLKLGFDKGSVFYVGLDDFEQDIVLRFYNDCPW
jgi:hypothetical protein